ACRPLCSQHLSFRSRYAPPPRSSLLPLHDPLPISAGVAGVVDPPVGIALPDLDHPVGHRLAGAVEQPPAQPERTGRPRLRDVRRSEEHTSELQSLTNLVCRLLLEKKKILQIIRLQP